MKRMTKEELIEYFMEQLEDNNVFRQAMTTDRIREKLNKNILGVTFEPESFGQGSYHFFRVEDTDRVWGNLNLDLDKLNKLDEDSQKMLVNHENTHVIGLNVKIVGDKLYCKIGFQLSVYVYDSKTETYVLESKFNTGVSEGMTHILAMNIAKKEKISGYENEQDTSRLLSIILGQDELIKIYCDEEIEKYFQINPYDIFKDLAISKYGKELGTKINEDIRKILALSDKLEILNRNKELDRNGLMLRREITKELHKTFLGIVKTIIDREPDMIKKIDIMKKCIPTSIKEDITKKVLRELVNDDTIDFSRKLELLRQIREDKEAYMPGEIVDNILFSKSGLEELTVEEQLEHYLYLMQKYTWGWQDKAYELCVASGRISEELFSKKRLFTLSMPYRVSSLEDLDENLKNSKYFRVGNYYGVSGKTDDFLADIQGEKTIFGETLDFNPFENDFIESTRDRQILPGTQIDVLCYQLKELVRKAEKDGKKYSSKITIFDNLIRMKYIIDGKELEEYYTVGANGMLQEEPIRRRT
ncbi:MAG: hypothetical protein IJN50_04260 [Clostridia bacterium]|nr:hypothetical protein [Clostridia bacterium]